MRDLFHFGYQVALTYATPPHIIREYFEYRIIRKYFEYRIIRKYFELPFTPQVIGALDETRRLDHPCLRHGVGRHKRLSMVQGGRDALFALHLLIP
jgi:hypothetical protein